MNKAQVRNFLSKVEFINNGGCLIAARAFQLFAEKHGLRVPHLVAMHKISDKEYFHNNLNFIQNNGNGHASSANHFGWSYGQTIFDCNSVLNPKDFYKMIRIPLELSDKFYKYAIKFGSWHWFFERDKELPRIQSVLGVDLSY